MGLYGSAVGLQEFRFRTRSLEAKAYSPIGLP